MKHEWTTAEIIEHFTLLEGEQALVGAKVSHNKLGQALLLKFFQHEARFPEEPSEIPRQAVDYVAQQLGLSAAVLEAYKWQGRSIKAHTAKLFVSTFGFHPATLTDQAELRDWLVHAVLPEEYRPVYLEERSYARLRERHLEPPSRKQVKRLITSACHRYEQAFFAQTLARLPSEVKARLRDLIHTPMTTETMI